MLISLDALDFGFAEQLLCALGERAGQRGITSLVEQEVAVLLGDRLLAVDGEGVLALCLECRVEAEHIPVTALDSSLHFLLAVDHAALDGVHLAGSVGDDYRRARISLSLFDSLYRLVHVSAHSYLSDIDIAVAHRYLGKALLGYRLTGSRELSDNITKLRTFASRADHNESLDTEDLAVFPNDELGEIAERIIKMYKRLQTTRREQDVLKRQLTQNIAHELKTPVASIQGYLETILENPNINDATREQFLQRSYAQSQRLTSLLQDISTLNRMDDAPEMMSEENVNISDIVSNIQKETALQLQQKEMKFCNRLQPNIVVRGSTSLLYSVFRNLTDNAIAYAGVGTTITIDAELSSDELFDDHRKWHFTFSDNGVGVPSEHLSRIFERFYRVDKGRSRKMGGTGLGLAIVKNAVLLHGGTISAHNNEEGGLRFEFTLRA